MFLNSFSEAAFLIAAGSLFQRDRAAEAKERKPVFSVVDIVEQCCCCLSGDFRKI